MAIFDDIKGISVASGFKLQAQSPLDPRLVVNTITELNELVSGNGAYDGMIVYVKEDKKTYQLQEANWVEMTNGGGSTEGLEKRIDNVEANIDSIKYYDDPTVTPSPTSWFYFGEDEENNGLLVTGLTDEGKSAINSGINEVIIPYESNGKKIIVLLGSNTDSIFKGVETKIEKVILPNTITQISGAFSGCTSLTSIN